MTPKEVTRLQVKASLGEAFTEQEAHDLLAEVLYLRGVMQRIVNKNEPAISTIPAGSQIWRDEYRDAQRHCLMALRGERP